MWTTDRTPLEELERLFPGMSDLSVPGDGPEVVNKYLINLLADFKPDLLALPRRIVQVPGLLVMLSGANPQRLVYTDGRKFPVDPQPAWLGYSVGSWEGDTLVIETRGFNDKTWLDAFGHPRSEAMRITERLRRRDVGHLDVQVTIDDATVYTRPFSIRYSATLTPDTDLLDTVCENERDVPHLVGK